MKIGPPGLKDCLYSSFGLDCDILRQSSVYFLKDYIQKQLKLNLGLSVIITGIFSKNTILSILLFLFTIYLSKGENQTVP